MALPQLARPLYVSFATRPLTDLEVMLLLRYGVALLLFSSLLLNIKKKEKLNLKTCRVNGNNNLNCLTRIVPFQFCRFQI